MVRAVPATETSAADWLVTSITTFAESVHSLLPEGFPAYVRIFHPAYRFDLGAAVPWDSRTIVRWTEIAAANHAQAHAGMQLSALTGTHRFRHAAQPGVYDHAPSEGSLPIEVAEPLISILTRHTSTPEVCWFALWNGFGNTREDIRGAARFHLPQRDYFLLHGPVNAIGDRFVDGFSQSPNIWWPDDRAWCVTTEIDLNTTYVACSEACRDSLLATKELEAFAIDPATGIGWTSDRVNPSPPAS